MTRQSSFNRVTHPVAALTFPYLYIEHVQDRA